MELEPIQVLSMMVLLNDLNHNKFSKPSFTGGFFMS